MTALVWDHKNPAYDSGIDRGVLYISGVGYSWNGLTAVAEKIPGGKVSTKYFDGLPMRLSNAMEDYDFTLQAFTYPAEFANVEGENGIHDQQPRRSFGLSYRVQNGSGYKLHIVYGAMAVSAGNAWESDGSKPKLVDFKWDVFTTPLALPGYRPTSHLVVDSLFANANALADLEHLLYGTVSTAPALPTYAAIRTIFDSYATIIVTDNGDGSFSVNGPDSAVYMNDSTTFTIDWPSVTYLSPDTYDVHSM